MRIRVVIAATAIAFGVSSLNSQRTRPQRVGPLDQGGFLLNTGWRIRPAGKTIPVSTLPMSTAVLPGSRMMAVLNGGFLPSSVTLLDMETMKSVDTLGITDGWRGIAFSADGTKVYAGNGARGSISELSISGSKLTESRKISLYPSEAAGTPHLIADIVSLNGQLLVADSAQDKILVVDPGAAKVVRDMDVARNPFAILPSPDGKALFVSSWSTAQVLEYNIASGSVVSTIPVGAHPTEMAWLPGGRLAVACANTNRVYLLAKRGSTWVTDEEVNIALTPQQPVGMTPSSLSLSPDNKTLYVVCSDANAVAVIDVAGESAKVRGFIPTGWYPTTVRALGDGRLVVVNGKGSGSRPNPAGLNPYKWGTPKRDPNIEYVAAIQTGTVSVVDAFQAPQLAAYTRTVIENSPYRDALLDRANIPSGNPVPQVAGGPTPIKHVILLMKENRTYDQVLGDMKEGNGDPSLVLFGEKVTPNHHQLARDFVLLDNFYVNADVSADGLYWTTAAIAPDSNQRLWPMGYARRMYARPRPGPEGSRSAPGGFLWDKAVEAGVSYYNYGFLAVNRNNPPDTGVQIAEVQDPILKKHTSMLFRQHDRTFSDIKRIQVFLNDLAEWEKKGNMPQLILMTIGNDHTEGMRPGIRTPISCIADNDQAVGIMVEGLSKSKFWSSTAMFVLEDDAQDGADHVDSHRSPAYVISPYARRGAVDSTIYNTTSTLRTIELILGLKPMTMFDAAATPMANAFQATPDLRPYANRAPQVPLDEKNPMTGPLADRSRRLDFEGSDKADERELNEILWLAIKGSNPPAPVRSAFAH